MSTDTYFWSFSRECECNFVILNSIGGGTNVDLRAVVALQRSEGGQRTVVVVAPHRVRTQAAGFCDHLCSRGPSAHAVSTAYHMV